MLDLVAGGGGYRQNRPGSGENRWRLLGLRREDARQVWTKGRTRKNGGAREGSLPSLPMETEGGRRRSERCTRRRDPGRHARTVVLSTVLPAAK
jgi:hypothetical protein